jgi:hypothetical protein
MMPLEEKIEGFAGRGSKATWQLLGEIERKLKI